MQRERNACALHGGVESLLMSSIDAVAAALPRAAQHMKPYEHYFSV
jgi:hypothetical protein